MQYREFARTGWKISEIGFGAWQIGGEWGETDDAHSILRVIPLAVNSPRLSLLPDHAGIFETTLLHALHPGSVNIGRLPPFDGVPLHETLEESYGPKRHDASHPLHGVIGSDPRLFRPDASDTLLEAMVDYVVAKVKESLPMPD
jgi:creatinine amidohydrolase